MSDLASLVVTLEADISRWSSSLDSAITGLNRFSEQVGEKLTEVAGDFVAAFTVDRLVEWQKGIIDGAEELGNFSQSTGIAVEQLSALQFAAAASGVGSDQLQGSLKKLNQSISEAAGNAKSQAALAFNLLGVSATNANGSVKDAGEVMSEVADKFAASADGPNKVAIAMALMGRNGEAMIPTLNKGSDGLNALGAAGKAAGAVINDETAVAAEMFNSKVNLLSATMKGLGGAVADQILPILNDLADDFLDTAHNGEGLRTLVDELTTGFKLLATAGIGIKTAFAQVGDAFGGAAAAINQAIHGNFSAAMGILNDQSAQAAASSAKASTQIANVWDDSLNQIIITAKKMKEPLASLADATAVQAALEKLQAFATSLQAEAAKADIGTIAATKLKLAHGELAEALAKTGAAGQKYANDAIAAAGQIEMQGVSKQIADVQASLLAFSGDTVTAGIVKQAASVQELTTKIMDLGDKAPPAWMAALQAEQTNNTMTLEFQKNQTDYATVQANLAAKTADIQIQQTTGLITELQAQQQLDAERAKAATLLGQIAQNETAIGQATGNQQMITQAQSATTAVKQLAAQTNTLATTIRGDLESDVADSFLKVETGAESAQKAIEEFFKSLQKQLLSIANKDIAQQIFGTGGAGSSAPGFLAGLFGGSSGGGSSGIAGLFSGLFGGGSSAMGPTSSAMSAATDDLAASNSSMLAGLAGFASGGTMAAGSFGIVGENGPELAYAGSRDLHIQPMSSGSAAPQVSNTFVMSAPGGTITRQSQTQAAAEVARQVSIAARRNG